MKTSAAEILGNIGLLLGEGKSWRQIGDVYPDIGAEALRSRWRRRKQVPTHSVTGVTSGDIRPNLDDAMERAAREWEVTSELGQMREQQVIEFSHGPVALVWVADLHIGGSGVDYPRMFDEAEIIADTPGMYLGLVGDLVDSFIIGKLLQVRMGTRLNITDEWVLLRKYLEIVKDKILVSVGGNHDYWHTALSGIDYLADVMSSISSSAIYDQDDARVTVKIGDVEWPGRIRHKWRGSSIYNDTHGIERASKWDQDFLWGVGAHDHASGLGRQFNNAGRTGLAMKCGSYKRVDKHARKSGFPKHNESTAIAVVFNELYGTMTPFNCLHTCADYMRAIYNE